MTVVTTDQVTSAKLISTVMSTIPTFLKQGHGMLQALIHLVQEYRQREKEGALSRRNKNMSLTVRERRKKQDVSWKTRTIISVGPQWWNPDPRHTEFELPIIVPHTQNGNGVRRKQQAKYTTVNVALVAASVTKDLDKIMLQAMDDLDKVFVQDVGAERHLQDIPESRASMHFLQLLD